MRDNAVFLKMETDVDGAAHLARGPVPRLHFRTIALETGPESPDLEVELRQ